MDTNFQNDFVHIIEIAEICLGDFIVAEHVSDGAGGMAALRDYSAQGPLQGCSQVTADYNVLDYFVHSYWN